MPQPPPKRKLIFWKEHDVALPGYRSFSSPSSIDLYPPPDALQGRWASKEDRGGPMGVEFGAMRKHRGRIGCFSQPDLTFHREAGNRYLAMTPAGERPPARQGLFSM